MSLETLISVVKRLLNALQPARAPGGSSNGGRGGDVIIGGSGIGIGGDGGGAAQYGRPGLGGQSVFERLGLGHIVLPDGRRLGDIGRGGDGGAPPILYEGKHYNLPALICGLPREKLHEIDQTMPPSAQEWWNRFVSRRPYLATEIIANTEPMV